MGEDLKQRVRDFIAAVDTGDVAVLDEFVSPDFVDHNPAPIPGLEPGLDGLKQTFRYFAEATPGTHSIDLLLQDGDYVVAYITGRGTHEGDLFGVPATGRPIEMPGIVIYRFRDGKIVEKWAEHNTLPVLMAIGAVPTPAPA
jgi:predicted ester cyclase